MRVYTIKAGRHNPGWEIPGIHLGRRDIARDVAFHDNCAYDLGGPDQLDVNKLFGLSYGWHHRNSARFGWRWDLDRGMMEILAYCYVDGQRLEVYENDLHIAWVRPGAAYRYAIRTTNTRYQFSITSGSGRRRTLEIVHGMEHPGEPGYYLNIYFGGNRAAPHRMDIGMSRILRGADLFSTIFSY